jgi:protein tyrosine/serine phosphatase
MHIPRISIGAIGLLVLTLSGAPAFAAGSSAPSATDLASISIENFGRVSSTYYRGGQPVGDDYAKLAALGVKTVINLTSDDADRTEPAMVKDAGMRYVPIPMTTHAVPTTAQLAEFLDIVNDPASQPVYVHCVGGRHRTGVMTAVYRMTDDGWTADQAFKEMKTYKFGADFLHSEFKSFVYGYHPAAQAPKATEVLAVSNPGIVPVAASAASAVMPVARH